MTTSRTFSPRPRDIERRWYVIDADGVVLGRLATHVASILRGKHKPIYAPHADTGDHVIVINAGGVRLTGGKEDSKMAYRHSGYPGGLTAVGYSRLMSERPAFVVEKAVRGMLPKNRLGRSMVRKLMVYPGPEHPHAAQKPETLATGAVPPWSGLPEPKPAPERAPAKKKKAAPKSRSDASRPATKTTAARGRATTSAKAPSAKTASTRSTAKKSSAKAAAAPEAETTTKTRRTRRSRAKQEKE
jgi:large subunit ribosomal protein L13